MGSIDSPNNADNDNHHHHLAGASPEFAVTPTENESYRKRKSSILPLEVGTRVLCRWRDSKYHPVKVIERRRLHCGGPNDYEYYVHYTECQFSLSLSQLLGLGFQLCLFSITHTDVYMCICMYNFVNLLYYVYNARFCVLI